MLVHWCFQWLVCLIGIVFFFRTVPHTVCLREYRHLFAETDQKQSLWLYFKHIFRLASRWPSEAASSNLSLCFTWDTQFANRLSDSIIDDARENLYTQHDELLSFSFFLLSFLLAHRLDRLADLTDSLSWGRGDALPVFPNWFDCGLCITLPIASLPKYLFLCIHLHLSSITQCVCCSKWKPSFYFSQKVHSFSIDSFPSQLLVFQLNLWWFGGRLVDRGTYELMEVVVFFSCPTLLPFICRLWLCHLWSVPFTHCWWLFTATRKLNELSPFPWQPVISFSLLICIHSLTWVTLVLSNDCTVRLLHIVPFSGRHSRIRIVTLSASTHLLSISYVEAILDA